ncbi:MAG: terminase small subunit [Candidatus Omnitrophica bacterium]|nr:terminase small subunit [Candidatus Omnitrophota bacterium]
MPKLTYKQRLFVSEFLSNGMNGSEAVRKSYPNIKTKGAIRQMAHKLVTHGNVKAEIEKVTESLLDDKLLLAEEAIRNTKESLEYIQNKKTWTNNDIATKHKLERTILELAGQLGSRNNTLVAINNNQSEGVDVKTMSTIELCMLKKRVDAEVDTRKESGDHVVEIAFFRDSEPTISDEETKRMFPQLYT